MPRGVIALIAASICLLLPPVADASQLIDRNAQGAKLAVNPDGIALVTYRASGRLKHVLAWGAVNAIAPTETQAQVAFKLDYSGGWGAFKKMVWRGFKNICQPVSTQVVAFQVAACQSKIDASYWALQAWQRALPNYGVQPNAKQAVMELRLSHWTGALPQLSVGTGWAYQQYDHLFGTLTYNGQGVHGFKSTPTGVPLDTFGRNLYLDTLNSAYGAGWKRENSFLAHGPTGSFCYGFYPHGKHPVGKSTRYRMTVIGPGVTPDVSWEGPAPGTYDPLRSQEAAGLQRQLMSTDSLCVPRL